MWLFIMQVRREDGTPRGISVWVEADDDGKARAMASARLAEAGWTVIQIDDETETKAGDYFRACPSQQAFLRAQQEGIAWRFDVELSD